MNRSRWSCNGATRGADVVREDALTLGLAEYCKENFIGWGEEAPGEGSVRSWSGIICASRDLLPLVGEVPGKEGLWVAVGFHGESLWLLTGLHLWPLGSWKSRHHSPFSLAARYC